MTLLGRALHVLERGKAHDTDKRAAVACSMYAQGVKALQVLMRLKSLKRYHSMLNERLAEYSLRVAELEASLREGSDSICVSFEDAVSCGDLCVSLADESSSAIEYELLVDGASWMHRAVNLAAAERRRERASVCRAMMQEVLDRAEASKLFGAVQLEPYGVLGERSTLSRGVQRVGGSPTQGTAIVDPAGLHFIQQHGPAAAGGASGAVYAYIALSAFPETVRDTIRATGDACYHQYATAAGAPVHCIHVVGPDLAVGEYTRQTAAAALAKAYEAVFIAFAATGLRSLRLAPISSGIFAGPFASQAPALAAAAIKIALRRLPRATRNRLQKERTIHMCIFAEGAFSRFVAAGFNPSAAEASLRAAEEQAARQAKKKAILLRWAKLAEQGMDVLENTAASAVQAAWRGKPQVATIPLSPPSKKRLARDGFALKQIVPRERAVWKALRALLQTDSAQLGRGRDVTSSSDYDSLRLARAWRIVHPLGWTRYVAGLATVKAEMERIRKGAGRGGMPGVKALPTKTAAAATKLAKGLAEDANETLLLHGTSPSVLLSLISNGLNERFSGSNAGTAFGDGIYLAEDAGKTDQYVQKDPRFDPSDELHKRLYGASCSHPSAVYYLLVVRVALGLPVRTTTMGRAATSMDDRSLKVFPVTFRELATVPSVSPPANYHSLVAEIGGSLGRFREFITFHGEYVYPEFLVAYQRFKGSSLVR